MKVAMAVIPHAKKNLGESPGLPMVIHQTGKRSYAQKRSLHSSCVNGKLKVKEACDPLLEEVHTTQRGSAEYPNQRQHRRFATVLSYRVQPAYSQDDA